MIHILNKKGVLDATDTMYPCYAGMHDGKKSSLVIPKGSSCYGFVISGEIYTKTLSVGAGSAFSSSTGFSVGSEDTRVWYVVRHGVKAVDTVVVPEHKGRLSYIDGCSDSLLIYPPRKGDGSLSLLYFPTNIQQTFHTHPSIRLGYVASGSGTAHWAFEYQQKSCSLRAGDYFMLEAHSKHRFTTDCSDLRILAYHPDGDWGPEDHNHTMLNRTYLK
jgi:hypothetical protein